MVSIAQSWLLEETRTGFLLFGGVFVFAITRVRLKLLLMMTTTTPFGMETALVPVNGGRRQGMIFLAERGN